MSDYGSRIDEFRKKLAEEGMSGAVVLSRENICYLTGFCVAGHERLTALVVRDDSSYLVVPKLSEEQIRESPVDRKITWDDRSDPYQLTKETIQDLPGGSIAIESSTPLFLYQRFGEQFGKEPKFVDSILHELRQVKRKDELERMREAVRISEAALTQTIGEIKPGMREKEIAGILDFNMRKNGSDGTGFPTTVASGANSAIPHHTTSDKPVEKGESVVIDFGAAYRSYTADMTRTFAIDHAPDGFKEVYETVRKAQAAGIEYAAPGMPAGDIDLHVRGIIEEAGYGKYFTHRTGHGIGLLVHEPPYINESNRVPLKPPVTFTIEPGIYIPGKYGVRIEDMVLLEERGASAVNAFTKELTVI